MTRGICQSLVFVCLVFTADAVSCNGDEEVTQQLQSAIKNYRHAMQENERDSKLAAFQLAEQQFRQVIATIESEQRETLANANLYLNLGNAALQAEHLGPAIWAYRRALLQRPDHAQAAENLMFARSMLPARFQHSTEAGLVDTLFFWKAFLSESQIRFWAGVWFLLAAIGFAIGITRRKSQLVAVSFVPVAVWALLLISVLGFPSELSRWNAVIVSEDVTVRSADSINSPPRLQDPLPGGVEVRVTRERQRWREIEWQAGKTGWVRTTEVAIVSPNER